MAKDRATISNRYYELTYVAGKLNVPVWFVMFAKEKTETNDRATVENWIRTNWEQYKEW